MSSEPTSAPVRVNVKGDSPYAVLIGRHLLGELPAMLGKDVQKVLIIHPESLSATADVVRDDLLEVGYEALQAEVPDAEESKTAQVAGFCWQVLGQADFTRSDAIVTIGGGATTDLGGFVAATWLRGVKVVHISTTLLGMVDAAVGGKTGINTSEGKNLVGSFYPPAGVLCDIDAFETLPKWDFVAGLAEIIKCGFVSDERVLELIETHADDLKQGPTVVDEAVLVELIERAVQWKADVVADDLKETGNREFLNYGHTFAHAIEHVERFSWRHGAAVSVGMVFVAELARLAGRLDEETVDRHRRILSSVGLPLTYRSDRWDQLMAAMRRDKKSRGPMLRFIVLEAQGKPARLEGPDPSLLAAAYAEVGDERAQSSAIAL